jgi:hypothetical protein
MFTRRESVLSDRICISNVIELECRAVQRRVSSESELQQLAREMVRRKQSMPLNESPAVPPKVRTMRTTPNRDKVSTMNPPSSTVTRSCGASRRLRLMNGGLA